MSFQQKMKFNFYLIVASLVVMGYFFPVVVLSQSSSSDFRCWTKDQCNSAGGIWGKDTNEFSDGLTGCAMDGGEVVSGNCVGGSSSEGDSKCDDLYGSPAAKCYTKPPTIKLQVPIPGLPVDKKTGEFTGGLAVYIAYFYKFFISAIAVMAVVMVMWGGFKRIYAAGSPEKIKDANDTIVSAISGLAIALLSYTLLNIVNPKLTNISPLSVAMVKTDTMGFCPKYDDNKSIYDGGYKQVSGECVGGTRNKLLCNTDDQCPNGSCGSTNSVKKGKPGYWTCGIDYELNGRVCTGQECPSGQGCFTNYIDIWPKYYCSNFFIQGKLAGIEVNYIDLLPVCNSGNSPANDRHGCVIAGPNSDYGNTIDVEEKSSYAIVDCLFQAPGNIAANPIRPKACGTDGLKGYALLIEVESSGSDDWYAIDALSCNTGKTLRITGNDDDDDPKADIVDRLDFSTVSADKLFNPGFDVNGAILKPINCDLNITREEFRDR